MAFIKDYSGSKFHMLTVLHPTNKRSSSREVIWECRCDCGKLTESTIAKMRSGDRKSCGCYFQKIRGHSRKQNYTWRDRPQTPKRVALSRRCYERDQYSCIVCGINHKLHAHHLFSFHSTPDKRDDLDNLVTLCRDHHMEFHRMFGRKNNTPQQFYEFMGVI